MRIGEIVPNQVELYDCQTDLVYTHFIDQRVRIHVILFYWTKFRFWFISNY